MSVLSRYKVSVQVMSEQQMEVEDERGGRKGGREGGGSLLPKLLSYPLLSSERLSFPRSERHNIVPHLTSC